MAYAYAGERTLDYFPCRYGKSKLLFRGPQRDLDGDYCAVLGGTETYGKFVPTPFPDLVERSIGMPVVNLGCVNAGLDMYLGEPAAIQIAVEARVSVVQIVGAQNLTNRFYAVHPRRNDRFLRASPLMRSIFADVDFTEFHFTRHMLQSLQSASAERFEVVAEELRAAWVSRMGALLSRIGGKTVLVWISDHAPPAGGGPAALGQDPLLVDADMIRAVRPYATEYLQVVSSPEARAQGLEGMAYAPFDEPAALGLPGPAVHAEIAAALAPVLERLL